MYLAFSRHFPLTGRQFSFSQFALSFPHSTRKKWNNSNLFMYMFKHNRDKYTCLLLLRIVFTLCNKSLHSFTKFVRRFKRSCTYKKSMTDGLTDRPVKHYAPCNFVTWVIINIVFRPFGIPLNFLVKNMWWAKTNRWKNPEDIIFLICHIILKYLIYL